MDWSNDIPEELLDLILSKVFTKDRHTFSLVCRSWNAAVASSYRHAPCLMINQRSKHVWKVFQQKNFFYMDFPELDNTAVIHCSKHGWWLMSRDDETFFFFNPFHNHKIEIPTPTEKSYSTLSFFHPPTSTDCFIVGIDTYILTEFVVKIAYLKHGEDEWQIYKRSTKRYLFTGSLAPPILHRGLVYFLDVKGNLATFDITKPNLDIFTRCLKQRRLGKNIREHFLVEPKGDDVIFAVFATHDERKVKVFRLITEPKFLWEPVEDLGDKVFYVSNTSSFGYTTSVKSMANKICFPTFHGDDNLVSYSLKTRKYHSYEGGYSSENSYGLKRLNFATWTMAPPTSQLQGEILPWYPQEDDDNAT